MRDAATTASAFLNDIQRCTGGHSNQNDNGNSENGGRINVITVESVLHQGLLASHFEHFAYWICSKGIFSEYIK